MAFDRLQAAGWGLYCLSEPNVPVIVLHAIDVVVQAGFEVMLILWLARQVRDNAEVAALAESLSRGEPAANRRQLAAPNRQRAMLVQRRSPGWVEDPALPVTLREVAALPLVIPSRPNALRVQVDAAMAALGV